MWITTAERIAVPTDGTEVLLYDNKQVTKPNVALNVATYLGWLLFEIGQQTANLDIQVRSPGLTCNRPYIQRMRRYTSAWVQALGARLEVLLLEDVILKNGVKTIQAANHFEPALQQDKIWDFGALLEEVHKHAVCRKHAALLS